MKVPLYIAIYAPLITLCSMKSNNSSNKTPGKKVYYKLIQKNLGISISDRTSGPLLWQNHQISTFPDYRKLRLISSVLIHLRQGFTEGLTSEAGLHLSGIITSRTRKSASKQNQSTFSIYWFYIKCQKFRTYRIKREWARWFSLDRIHYNTS